MFFSVFSFGAGNGFKLITKASW